MRLAWGTGLARFKRIRDASVPPTMIAAATAARAAGDWRGACAAAMVDVDVDLVAVRREHGRRAADAIEEDLAHFAPDLLRWHFPRTDELWRLLPWLSAVLTPEGTTKGPLLELAPPSYVSRPQRLALRVTTRRGLSVRTFFDAPRRLWDVRRAAELGHAWGRSADRVDETDRILALLSESRHIEAWRVAGIDLDPVPPQSMARPFIHLDAEAIWPVGVADEARRLSELYGLPEHPVAVAYGARVVVAVSRTGDVTARLGTSTVIKGRPQIGAAVAQVPFDLDLLARGLISADELHPLVRASLFPTLGPAPSRVPSDGLEPVAVRVRCRGVWHRVQVVDGRIRALDHDDPDEERREALVRALGGTSAGCFAALAAWIGGRGRLPRLLRYARRDVFERMQYGDTELVLRMLDAGWLDPRVRDGEGMTVMHMLAYLDHEALLPRLLAAGLDVQVRDHRGRTPLHLAVARGGSVGLIRALRDAGADPDAADAEGFTPRHGAHTSKRTDLGDVFDR